MHCIPLEKYRATVPNESVNGASNIIIIFIIIIIIINNNDSYVRNVTHAYPSVAGTREYLDRLLSALSVGVGGRGTANGAIDVSHSVVEVAAEDDMVATFGENHHLRTHTRTETTSILLD